MSWKMTKRSPAAPLHRCTAAPRGGCGEPGRGFPDPGQPAGIDVPLLGQHRLLRDIPFPDQQFRRGHLRRGHARPDAGHNLPLGSKPPFRRAPVRVDELSGFGFGSGRGHHPARHRQRHVQQAHHDDQPRGAELAFVIPAAAVPRIGSCRPQQPRRSCNRRALSDSWDRRENSPIVICAARLATHDVYPTGNATSNTSSSAAAE